MARPALKRQAVAYIRGHYTASLRWACRLVRFHRSVSYYRSVKDPKLALRARMRELAQVRIRFGHRRMRREGWMLGRDQVYRLYTEESLQLRSKRPRRRKMIVARRSASRRVDQTTHGAWTSSPINCQRDALPRADIVDLFSREGLAVRVGQRLRGQDVVDVCNRLVAQRGAPKRIFVDNGSEFSGRLLDLWAYHHKVRIDFSRPGTPTDNPFVESFNGSLRDECLNAHWFESLEEAAATTEAWRQDYNETRPHQSLKDLTPRNSSGNLRI
jgi:putative transposase